MISPLLATADINKTKQRLRDAKTPPKRNKLVVVGDDLALLQLVAQALQIKNNVDDDAPVRNIAVVRVGGLKLVP
jgi:hypothetical protein